MMFNLILKTFFPGFSRQELQILEGRSLLIMFRLRNAWIQHVHEIK